MSLETTEFNMENPVWSNCFFTPPVYIHLHCLQQAFQLLNDQTYKEWNLFVVDDGNSGLPFD